ncbi:hypothetical protein K504DRAFT_447651 [Pleomassaria siparia CBS 279.74]|uniref:Uncharacterized protein n=1 Tax=Pleomassaria siparia CBS 279.74 TaxID=1314801 RepID=A0A6G1K1K7_9PLEO|nr:hypothetical protein K504DRAFT_447651 [Pleomassaria siparia CBS 279.74]
MDSEHSDRKPFALPKRKTRPIDDSQSPQHHQPLRRRTSSSPPIVCFLKGRFGENEDPTTNYTFREYFMKAEGLDKAARRARAEHQGIHGIIGNEEDQLEDELLFEVAAMAIKRDQTPELRPRYLVAPTAQVGLSREPLSQQQQQQQKSAPTGLKREHSGKVKDEPFDRSSHFNAPDRHRDTAPTRLKREHSGTIKDEPFDQPSHFNAPDRHRDTVPTGLKREHSGTIKGELFDRPSHFNAPDRHRDSGGFGSAMEPPQTGFAMDAAPNRGSVRDRGGRVILGGFESRFPAAPNAAQAIHQHVVPGASTGLPPWRGLQDYHSISYYQHHHQLQQQQQQQQHQHQHQQQLHTAHLNTVPHQSIPIRMTQSSQMTYNAPSSNNPFPRTLIGLADAASTQAPVVIPRPSNTFGLDGVEFQGPAPSPAWTMPENQRLHPAHLPHIPAYQLPVPQALYRQQHPPQQYIPYHDTQAVWHPAHDVVSHTGYTQQHPMQRSILYQDTHAPWHSAQPAPNAHGFIFEPRGPGPDTYPGASALGHGYTTSTSPLNPYSQPTNPPRPPLPKISE